MASEPNLLNRITITVEANNLQVAKKVLHGSLLNQANINKLFNSYFDEYNIHQDISLEILTLNLGEISFHNFNLLFPNRLKVALNKALRQYHINNHREEIILNEPIPAKFNDETSLSGDNHLIDAENFIYFLYQKDPQFNLMEVITDNKNSNIKIEPLINQLMQIGNKSASLLAKSCLSEHGLQRLLAIRQPALLQAISRRLSERRNRSQYQEEPIYSEQLILNALEYIQRYNIQNIPKPDKKIILRITAKLNNLALNPKSIIELFRQAVIANNPLLNEWLEQFWQIESIAQLCKKHLSIQQYKNLINLFNDGNQPAKEQFSQQITSANWIITEIFRSLSTEHHKNLPKLNQHQLSLISTAIQQGEIETQNILQLFQHPALYDQTDTAWLVPLWQLAPVSQICKKHLSVEKYQHLSAHFIAKQEDKNESGKKSIITSKPVLLPEHRLPRQVNNAGILILWPMLPVLFNQLGLLEEQKFIHRQAQFSAVNLLDYLIWETEEIPTERKILNNVLCGLMADENSESIPIEPEKQLITTQWLDAIITQLPSWKKLSRNNVRQLFLQRPGELRFNEQEINITIQHQPFDALLTDWPWPLNIAKLPWLDRPLRIDWQNI
ncbi:contractile injection system tape measure protein [Photorhabdus cinerea]|uniref:Uncharacterized protein n=1 Tax=Photorhabdus cinerea TaxID=471575 RepID=A0A7X5QC76_9GAMM|nr:contractile injection system tape measure protein [Photorhabdus cinerea]NHB91620.1 hypothetical protein [Photorhabdus cinerea]